MKEKINPRQFVEFLKKNKISFFSGVPDSCTLQFCNELFNTKNIKNIIAANEGVAVSLGVGHYLATKKLPCIYMQNSGIGNATDPITNLCEKSIYNIPLLLLIGWRGVPGIKDEPQHNLQGKILKKILKLYGIKFALIQSKKDFKKASKLITYSKKNSSRIAFIFKPNTFEKSKKIFFENSKTNIKRADILNILLSQINKKTKIVSSVGYNSRELYQIRIMKKNFIGKDFLMVGAMGHTAPTAISISNHFKGQVICLDGDGSFIMHMGALTSLSEKDNKNFKYLLIDNSSHESIGGQPINLTNINIKSLAMSLNFRNFYYTNQKNELAKKFKKFIKSTGPSFFHVKIKRGTLHNLLRPKNLIEIKKKFMKKI